MSEFVMVKRELLERCIKANDEPQPSQLYADLRAVLAQEAGWGEHPGGRRERFQKWVMATKHPVLGYLDGHWLERGDDREGYANEYVQGLWVAFKEFAEPPALVSADLSELREYHAKAISNLKSYADDAGLRDSDVKHYTKRADFHASMVALIDKLKELNQ